MNKCFNCNGECPLYEDFCCETCEREWKEEEGEYEEEKSTLPDNEYQNYGHDE